MQATVSVRHWHQGATARLSAAPKAVAPAVSTAIVAVEGKSGYERRKARHFKLRKRVSGTTERPRLAVFRSNQHIYAQVIDDTQNKTLYGLGSVSEAVQAELEGDKISKTKSKTAAEVVGRKIAEKCKEMGVEKVVFDRGGFLYHGRVAALADAAREGGLVF